MEKFCKLDILEFKFVHIMDHPLYPGIQVKLHAVAEDTKDTWPECEETAQLIIDRVNEGNLAAWFRATVTVFCDLDYIAPEEVVLAHCTHVSFYDFMEDEIFLSVVDELTADLIEYNKSDPVFLSMFTPRSNLAS